MLSPQVAAIVVEVPTALATDCNLPQVTATARHLLQSMVPTKLEYALLLHVKPIETTSDDTTPTAAMQAHASSKSKPTGTEASTLLDNLSTNSQLPIIANANSHIFSFPAVMYFHLLVATT